MLSGLRPLFLLTSKVVGIQVPVMTFFIRHRLATINGAEEVQFIQAVRRILEERYLHRFEPYISNLHFFQRHGLIEKPLRHLLHNLLSIFLLKPLAHNLLHWVAHTTTHQISFSTREVLWTKVIL